VAAVVIAVVVVAPFFIGFMLVMPVVGIAIVMAVADVLLVVAFTAEMIIAATMLVEVQVGLRFVHDYLVTVVEIEVAVAGGEVTGENPAAFTLIDELVIGNIVVRLDVRDVVVVDMIGTRGTPGGLDANVNRYMYLRVSRVGDGEADEDGACQKEIFHTF